MDSTKIIEKKTAEAHKNDVQNVSNNIETLEKLKKFVQDQIGVLHKQVTVLDVDWMQLCNFSEEINKYAYQDDEKDIKPSKEARFGDSTDINQTPLSLELQNDLAFADELPSDLEDY